MHAALPDTDIAGQPVQNMKKRHVCSLGHFRQPVLNYVVKRYQSDEEDPKEFDP